MNIERVDGGVRVELSAEETKQAIVGYIEANAHVADLSLHDANCLPLYQWQVSVPEVAAEKLRTRQFTLQEELSVGGTAEAWL